MHELADHALGHRIEADEAQAELAGVRALVVAPHDLRVRLDHAEPREREPAREPRAHVRQVRGAHREAAHSHVEPVRLERFVEAFVGELDPFLDETVAYVENLRAAGVSVELRRYPGCYHGFDLIRPGARKSREASGFLRERFAAAVDGDFAKQP